MSILGLERTPIGQVGRGFELTMRHGRTFDRWEAHYRFGFGAFGATGQIVMAVGQDPPVERNHDGMCFELERLDRATWRAYYRRNA